ncbi:MAG: Kae1-associated kinase Bud32 [Candidatus Bathyarchaeota archaeon]|nr:Kae1-associated kinase Bud32 [Candidatus Bathyarchaeota archaeon]
MEGLRLVAKGAEADLWLDPDWNGRKALIKRRGVKGYRHPELDRGIRRFRTVHEADIIHRAKEAGVPTPILYQVDPEEAAIVMQYVEGETVREIVEGLDGDERRRLFRMIGLQAGRLHGAGIVHGDLTTSNMIRAGDRVVFIDFGLGEVSREAEKRGVDLHLMRRMLTSTHFRHTEELFDAFEEGYRRTMGAEADEALRRMREIERRGRYVERENRLDGDG